MHLKKFSHSTITRPNKCVKHLRSSCWYFQHSSRITFLFVESCVVWKWLWLTETTLMIPNFFALWDRNSFKHNLFTLNSAPLLRHFQFVLRAVPSFSPASSWIIFTPGKGSEACRRIVISGTIHSAACRRGTRRTVQRDAILSVIAIGERSGDQKTRWLVCRYLTKSMIKIHWKRDHVFKTQQKKTRKSAHF